MRKRSLLCAALTVAAAAGAVSAFSRMPVVTHLERGGGGTAAATSPETMKRSRIVALFYGASGDDEIHQVTGSSSSSSSSSDKNAAAAATPKTTVVEYYPDFLPNPNPALSAVDVVTACMDTLLERKDAGLEVCFHFSSDRCRAAIGGSLNEFNRYAENPTFGYLIHCLAWDVVSVGPVIPGTQHRGSMQTVLMEARANSSVDQKKKATITDVTKENNRKDDDVDSRRFLWTLQQERRPPLQGCWMIHEVLYTKNAWQQTL